MPNNAFTCHNLFAQPAADSPRIAFMRWEREWVRAAHAKDCQALAQLLQASMASLARTKATQLAINTLASAPARYSSQALRLLLRAGAIVPSDCVPAFCAQGPAAIELLRTHGADLLGTDAQGANGLHGACRQASDAGFEKSWRLLLSAGLDPYAPDNHGLTPMAIAERNERKAVAQRLVQETTPRPRKSQRRGQ